jgi:4-nitrophenyl phosphatase
MSGRAVLPRGWLIDVEGVLVRDKSYRPVEGSVAWLNGLVEAEVPFCLVSNNTTHRPEQLIAALNQVGYRLEMEHLVGALGLGLRWLRERNLQRILWLGTPDLADYWSEEGFTLVREGACDAVVLGVNPHLTVADLDLAFHPISRQGVPVVCLHRNRFFLDAQGQPRLGPGAWAAALEALGGAGQVVTVGKPGEAIYHQALKRVGVQPHEALFISDDPEADLITAKRLGMQTAFVLSGKYADHGILGRMDEADWPHVVCGCPADLDQHLNSGPPKPPLTGDGLPDDD